MPSRFYLAHVNLYASRSNWQNREKKPIWGDLDDTITGNTADDTRFRATGKTVVTVYDDFYTLADWTFKSNSPPQKKKKNHFQQEWEWSGQRAEWKKKKKTKGQGFSSSGVRSKALKALCFNRIVRQETSSPAGWCCSEHNDWSAGVFLYAAWVIKSADTVLESIWARWHKVLPVNCAVYVGDRVRVGEREGWGKGNAGGGKWGTEWAAQIAS